jgi:hypothetical protein
MATGTDYGDDGEGDSDSDSNPTDLQSVELSFRHGQTRAKEKETMGTGLTPDAKKSNGSAKVGGSHKGSHVLSDETGLGQGLRAKVATEPEIVVLSSTPNAADSHPADKSHSTTDWQQFMGGKLDVHVIKAEHLPCMDLTGSADPYVKMVMGDHHKRVTKTLKNTLSPQWNEHFTFELDSTCNEMVFTLMDWDRFSTNDVIGECRIQLADVAGMPSRCSLQVSVDSRKHRNGFLFPNNVYLSCKLSLMQLVNIQVMKPGSSSFIVGKDHCVSTLCLSLSLTPSPRLASPQVPDKLLAPSENLAPPSSMSSPAACTAASGPVTTTVDLGLELRPSLGNGASKDLKGVDALDGKVGSINTKTTSEVIQNGGIEWMPLASTAVGPSEGKKGAGSVPRLALWQLDASDKNYTTSYASPRNIFNELLTSMDSSRDSRQGLCSLVFLTH